MMRNNFMSASECLSMHVHIHVCCGGSTVPFFKCVGVRLKPDGTRWRTGGEVKSKLANGLGSQYSHTTSEPGVSSITTADAHTSAASSRLNWRPCRFKWTRPFRRKTKSGFCACAIAFQTHYTSVCLSCTYPSVYHKSLAVLSVMCGEPSDTGTSFSRVPGLFPAIFIPPVPHTNILFTMDATGNVD